MMPRTPISATTAMSSSSVTPAMRRRFNLGFSIARFLDPSLVEAALCPERADRNVPVAGREADQADAFGGRVAFLVVRNTVAVLVRILAVRNAVVVVVVQVVRDAIAVLVRIFGVRNPVAVR